MIHIVYALLIVLLLFMFSSFLTICGNYKYYSKIYKELPIYTFVVNDCNGKYNKATSQIYALNKSFIYFGKNNSICLDDRVYIHNNCITYFDPYTLYWYIKYRKWFKKNIDVNTLESYNPFKHNILN